MSPEAFLRNALRLLLPLAVAFTVYLYLYPIFLGCAFPIPPTPSNEYNIQNLTTEVVDRAAAFRDTLQQHLLGSTRAAAPFRLLALGDPQIEGDTSIRNYGRAPFPHLTKVFKYVTFKDRRITLWTRTRRTLHDIIDFYFVDIPDFLESTRKRIDLFGNDFYLGHIYRTLHWWTRPTHVTVLGDLLGSQWIGDREFERRSQRFWNRSFRGGERVPDDIAAYPQGEYDLAGLLGVEDDDAATWRRRIINIAGNHDIGYAGDLTKARLERFELAFGKAAYELRFELPIANATTNATIYSEDTNPESDRLPPELRIVVLNDMNLDTPAVEQSLQDKTYVFVNDVINTASAVEFQGHFTVVLTHIPFYKDPGVCVDSPYFSFHAGGGVKEQNQLSADATRGLLEGIFGLNGDANAPGHGMGRRGVVLNGHDHEGCDVWHHIDQSLPLELEPEPEPEPEPPADDNGTDTDSDDDEQKKNKDDTADSADSADSTDSSSDHQKKKRQWQAARWGDARRDGLPGKPGVPGLREITVRSMMADFEGNAGLLSAWFDEDAWEWRFEYADCKLGRQYYWWFVHVYDLVVLLVVLAYGVLRIAGAAGWCDVHRWPPVMRRARARVEGSSEGEGGTEETVSKAKGLLRRQRFESRGEGEEKKITTSILRKGEEGEGEDEGNGDVKSDIKGNVRKG